MRFTTNKGFAIAIFIPAACGAFSDRNRDDILYPVMICSVLGYINQDGKIVLETFDSANGLNVWAIR